MFHLSSFGFPFCLLGTNAQNKMPFCVSTVTDVRWITVSVLSLLQLLSWVSCLVLKVLTMHHYVHIKNGIFSMESGEMSLPQHVT